jgi:stress-induced morphogen
MVAFFAGRKKVMQHSIVHRLLYEFFLNCTEEARAVR